MSERRDIQEAILKNWANLGYITSSRINDQLFLDDEIWMLIWKLTKDLV